MFKGNLNVRTQVGPSKVGVYEAGETRLTVGTIVQHIVVQKMMNRVSILSHASQALRMGESMVCFLFKIPERYYEPRPKKRRIHTKQLICSMS
jgi:hypothetical protein